MGVYAQLLSGKVVDGISRQPLEAAYISEAGGKASVMTDKDGSFTLKLSSEKSPLLISYVGYKPVTVIPEKGALLTIGLEPATLNLSDVVVLHSSHQPDFSTLSRIDLNLKPVRNTQELLRLVPGLFIAQHAGGGKAEQIFLRGFDCDHGTDVQISVDGMPVNMVSHAHGQGYADSHFIIPETINNIDYGAGPYYSSHGNLNTAGYVAFSTYNNIDRSRVQVEAGRYNTVRTLAMIDLLKKDKDHQSAYIAGDFYYTDGPTISKQAFNRFNLFGKYNLAISERTQLHATLSSFKSKWDASGQVPERAVESGQIDRFGSIDPSEGGHTERHNANVQLSHQFADGTRWENQVFYSRYIFNLYSDFTFFLNDPLHGDEINQAESRKVAGSLSKADHTYFFDNWSLHSTVAAGMRYDATNNSRLSHVEQRNFLSDIELGNIREANGFAFTEHQVSAGRWLIDAGARLDYLRFSYYDKLHPVQSSPKQGWIASPKLNIQYTVRPQLQFFAKAGKGFHSNDARGVVAVNNTVQTLPAAYGADLGFIVKPTDHLLLNVAFWYLSMQQEFVYAGDDGVVEPNGKSLRKGIDLIGRYQFSSSLFANVNINLTRPRSAGEPKGQNYIPLAPTCTSTGGLFYKKKEGLNGSITYRYIKHRPANEDNSIIAKGYLLLDGAVNYTRPKYEIGFSVENALNSRWNEAQFATESRLRTEAAPVTELNFTPGTPFFWRAKVAVFF